MMDASQIFEIYLSLEGCKPKRAKPPTHLITNAAGKWFLSYPAVFAGNKKLIQNKQSPYFVPVKSVTSHRQMN